MEDWNHSSQKVSEEINLVKTSFNRVMLIIEFERGSFFKFLDP